MHVRRGAARLTAALLLAGGAMLVGPAALAQEADPCAPAADGSVPEMCQGGIAPEPAPEPDPCAPDAEGTAPEMCQGGEVPEQEPTDPTDPCPPQPVEPGDGVVVDDGDQGVAVGEPAPDRPVSSEQTVDGPAPGTISDDGLICAFGAPVSAPVPDSAAGGGVTVAPVAAAPEAAAPNAAVGAGQLPRTGPKERVLALAALGAALLVLGAGAHSAGRRREV